MKFEVPSVMALSGLDVSPAAPSNHWNESNEPFAMITARSPLRTESCAGTVTVGGWQEPGTVSVMVSVCALPQGFETTNQYCVVTFSDGVLKIGEFVPTGFDVLPDAPSYHWKGSGWLPVMSPTLCVTCWPGGVFWLFGAPPMAGFTHCCGVTVMVGLAATPHSFETLTQKFFVPVMEPLFCDAL